MSRRWESLLQHCDSLPPPLGVKPEPAGLQHLDAAVVKVDNLLTAGDDDRTACCFRE